MWEEALQEAYAAAPAGEVILETLELRHPTFVDENDVLRPIRLVRDYGSLLEEDSGFLGDDVYGHILTLEANAPANPSTAVTFYSVMFDLKLPEQNEATIAGLQLTIDNATKIVSKYLDQAVSIRAPVEVTYREYLASDPSAPQLVIGNLTVRSFKSTPFSVSGTAEFADLINKKFPNKVYRPEDFPGLA